MFSDPTMRPQLEQYYEHKKAQAIDTLKAREADPDFQATVTGEIKMPDGTIAAVNGRAMTSEMAEKMFVPFDQWIETMGRIYEMHEKMYDIAQMRMDMLEQQNPDSPSGVRSTFSHDGVLLAYINKDGTTAMSNGSDKYLRRVVDKADELGLSGQARVDYLHREFEAALSKHFDELDVAGYTEATSPTKREFADMWYTDFDIDQVYKDALKEAIASLEGAKQWHDQWQKNIYEMQSFLIGLQEAA